MEELDVLKELFKELAGENVKFNMTFIDKDGKKEEFNLNTEPEHEECDCSHRRYDDLEKTIELKNKYIEQLVARLDKDNKEKIETQKKIDQSKLEYIELCKHFADNVHGLVQGFDALIYQLGFQNEDFYRKYSSMLSRQPYC